MNTFRTTRILFVTLAVIILSVTGCVSQPPKYYVSFSSAQELSHYLHWTEDRTPAISAHRGGPMPGYPENCIESFEHCLSFAPCIIECDVRMTADSVLVMMHDETLDRTTTGTGTVCEMAFAELADVRLVDNEGLETIHLIPTFAEVLQWARGRAVLTVDVKREVPFDLVVHAVEELQAEGYAVIITYTADQAALVHSLNPELMISVPGMSVEAFERLQQAGIPFENMVAFVGTREPSADIFTMWHEVGVQTILGTMGNLDHSAEANGVMVYETLYWNGADILSTDNPAMVATILNLAR